MAFDLMLGLIAMHQRGVVHRDMKPTNIGVMQGRLVALDLGLAQDSTRDDTELVAHPAVTGEHGFQLFICLSLFMQQEQHLNQWA